MTGEDDKPLIIFGHSTFSSLVAYYVVNDARRRVAAYTVNQAYLNDGNPDGDCVVAFENLASRFGPEDHDILLPIAHTRINGVRKERCRQAEAMGYRIENFVSSKANVWSELRVGKNVIIFEQAVVQPFAVLGENVIIRSGANIGHHSHVGSHTFVASGAVTGGNVTIGERCLIGLGAVLRDGITIGDRCVIGAGAVVTTDTEADGVYVGVPAHRLPDQLSVNVA